MKVKVGDIIYDGEFEPVMVILTEKDKENIANMLPDATKYCSYPKNAVPENEIHRWMRDE